MFFSVVFSLCIYYSCFCGSVSDLMVSAYAFQSVFPIPNGLIDVHVIYTVVVAVVVVCFSYHPHDSDMCVFTYIRVNSRARVPANDM